MMGNGSGMGRGMMSSNSSNAGTNSNISRSGYGMGPGMTGYGGYGYGMGPGMMGYGGYGYGMGPGMMGYGGYGYGMGRGMMGYGRMGGCGYGMGPGMMGYFHGPNAGWAYGNRWNAWQRPEQMQKFLDATVDLRRKLNDKMFDLHEALRKPSTPAETVAKLQKEIIDLRNKISEKAGAER